MKYIQNMFDIFKIPPKTLAGGFVIALIVFFIYLPFCGLGIDMEDAGLHLLYSQNAYTGAGYTWTSCFLTNWIAGFWMSLAPIPRMVWWGYLGGLIIYSIFVFFCFLIYSEFFAIKCRSEYLICLFALLAAQPDFGRSLLHYYSFPTTLTVVLFYFWIKVEKKINDYHGYCFLGLLSSLIFFSRITFILVIALPLFYLLYLFIVEKERRKVIIKQVIFYMLGMIAGFFIIFPVYQCWLQRISVYSQGSEISLHNIAYRLKSLYMSIRSLLFNILPRCIGFITLLIFGNCLLKKWRRREVFYILMVVIVIIYVVLCLVKYTLQAQCNSYYGAGLTLFFLNTVMPFSICYCFLILYENQKKIQSGDLVSQHLGLLAIFFTFCSFLIPFGSDVFCSKIGYLFPLLLLISGGIIYRFPCKGFHISIWGIIVVIALGAHLSYGYLNPIPFCCIAESSIPELAYMKTSMERQLVIDRTLNYIKKEIYGEKEILLFSCYHFMPLYVLGVQNWVGTGTIGTETLIRKIKKKGLTVALPRFVLIEGGKEMEELFEKEISSDYECIFRSENLEKGYRQNFRYSLLRRKAIAVNPEIL